MRPTGTGYETPLPITPAEIADCDAQKRAAIDAWGYTITGRRWWHARGMYHVNFEIRPKWWLWLLFLLGWGPYAQDAPGWWRWLRNG